MSVERFARVPDRVLELLRRRELTFTEFAELSYLAGRVNHVTGELSLTLRALHDELGFPYTLEKLRRDLLSLREKRELDFEIRQGQRRPILFRLIGEGFGLKGNRPSQFDSQSSRHLPLEVVRDFQRDRLVSLEVTSNAPAGEPAVIAGCDRRSEPSRPPTPPASQLQKEPSAAAEMQEQNQELQDQGSAAAEPEAPPRESEIRAVVDRLGDSDVDTFDQLFPLASSLSRAVFFGVVDRHRLRVAAGQVRNRTGLFRSFLERSLREAERRAAADAAAAYEAWTLEDHACFDAESYARGHDPWDVAEELLGRKLKRLGADDATLPALLEAAEAVYRKVATRRAA